MRILRLPKSALPNPFPDSPFNPVFLPGLLWLLGGLSLAGCLSASDPIPEPAPPLVSITSPLRTIAFTDTDYSDLKGFQAMVGGARLVILGEQTHGEGSTFEAKARLSRFLYEKMGFDVFILESGFFDVNQIWRNALGGAGVSPQLKNNIFTMFEKSVEMRPLFDYIDAHKSGPRPLRLAGMDSQHGGEYARTLLMRELQAFLVKHGSKRVLTGDWTWAKLQANTFLNAWGAKLSPANLARYQAYNDSLRAEVLAMDVHSADSLFDNSGYWENILLGLRIQADMQSDSTDNLRDGQMARNVRWLMDNPYKGRKAVIWTHNVHGFRSFASIYENDPSRKLNHLKLMGAHLAEAYGRDLFVLGVTGREGAYVDFTDLLIKDVPVPEADLVEAKFADTLDYALINLRDPPPQDAWLMEDQRIRLFDFIPFHARLPDLYDGLLYLRTAVPTNKPLP
jgi:erythromycin esterase